MPCRIKNPANIDLSKLTPHIQGMYDYFDQKLGFHKPPTMIFDSDPSNEANVLGKTAYYDPNSLEIHIYSDGRHPKDMLRSIAHELIHHRQNLEGRLDVGGYHGEGYYLENKELKKLEHEAMLEGNALMREYEDTLKRKEKKEMSLKEWKNNELNRLLMKKFGILKENKKDYDLEENQDRVFAPSHYCAHHVVYEGKKGFTVDHNWNKKLQKVTKYDVKFEDGSVIRNIHESKLTVLEAFTEEHHKRDDHPKVKKDKEINEFDSKQADKRDDELEEIVDFGGTQKRDDEIDEVLAGGGPDVMKRDDEENLKEVFPDAESGVHDKRDDDLEEIRVTTAGTNSSGGKRDDEELDEAAKPDFPDVDGDGDREEPISKAQKDKKGKEGESDDKDMSKVPPQLRKHMQSKMKENRVNLKKLVERVLKNNDKIMKKMKDK